MRLQLLSDLHLEFHADAGREFVERMQPAAETLVIAGDLTTLRWYSQVEQVLKTICGKFKLVVYVPGNHEFYGMDPTEGWHVLTALVDVIPNLRVLEAGECVHVGGKRIVGATMWFADDYLNNQYKEAISDFSTIFNFVPWVYQENKAWCDFAEKKMKAGDIVVTHHLPSEQSVPKQFQGSNLNRFFLCDMEKVIERVKPAVWLHGHTHDACDYKLGDCRVVCNPLGYPRERGNATFQDALVIEVP